MVQFPATFSTMIIAISNSYWNKYSAQFVIDSTIHSSLKNSNRLLVGLIRMENFSQDLLFVCLRNWEKKKKENISLALEFDPLGRFSFK